MGGSSDQVVQQSQQVQHSRIEEYYTRIDDVLSPPRHTVMGRELAHIDENSKYNDNSSTKNLDDLINDDEDDLSEEEVEEVTRTCVIRGHMFREHLCLRRRIIHQIY